MKKYFIYRNYDSAAAYENALGSAGYGEAESLEEADFLLFDYERKTERAKMQAFLKSKPGFIYPHTPYSSYFLWDGIYSPLAVQCNFVVTEAQKRAMNAIDYKSRIEVVGWSRCEIKEFSPARGMNLLFVPYRPLASTGRVPMKEDLEASENAVQFILTHREVFDSVRVRYFRNMQASGLDGMMGMDDIIFETGKFGTADAVRSIDQADVVIAANTMGYLAIARGKPTLLYGNNQTPHNSHGYVQNYPLYRDDLRFPLDLTMDNLQLVCEKETDEIRRWKQNNIGRQFDGEKFISVIREYVR